MYMQKYINICKPVDMKAHSSVTSSQLCVYIYMYMYIESALVSASYFHIFTVLYTVIIFIILH